MAGEDEAEAAKVATEWDRMSENERWLAFWEEAVKRWAVLRRELSVAFAGKNTLHIHVVRV